MARIGRRYRAHLSCVPVPEKPAAIDLVPAPDAPAGVSDATRRWALAFPDGARRFAGLTRDEAAAAAAAVAGWAPGRWDRALVEVALPVIVSDGAGPYLLDATGRITLALSDHPRLPGVRVAMGEPRPRHRVGLVRPAGDLRVWEWAWDAEVDPEMRVAALDALEGVTDANGADGWERREWR
jgi:hypothetical protein